MNSIPVVESTRIETDIRRKENQELSTIKHNLWKKWRGKMKVKESLAKHKDIKDSEKIEKRLCEIEKKIEEYTMRKEDKLKKRDKKKEEWRQRNKMIVEDSWGMLNWLHQYIAENKHEWERRREREKLESNKEYDIWKGMDEMEMIEIIKEQEKKNKDNDRGRRL